MPDITTLMMAAAGAGEESDDDFANTVLLLHGDGTNGAQNNTFLDSSTNNFTITRNGNTTQGSFTPFSKPDGRWGNYFGSNTANLKFASNAAFAIGTGNFTVECFVNFDAWASTNQRILMQDVSGGSNLQIGRDSGANNLFVVITGSTVINYSWSPTVGEFYHIAVVRSGTGTNEVALYIDGVSVATGTSNGSISQQQVIVGGLDWATGYNIQGYISNFRYSNVARTITVPTAPYTSDANTLILTCQSNRFLDNSSNAFAVTVNGTVKVTPFSPFPITTEYSPSVNGGSGYFDGSGDYLSLASDALLAPGTGDFTIEAWLYPTAALSTYNIVYVTDTTNALLFGKVTSGYGIRSTGIADIIAATAPAINQWVHVAASRSGTTLRLFINGVLSATVTDSTNYATSTVSINSLNNAFTGYISGFRFVKGSALYTATFSIPTAPPTAVSNTNLLTNFSNAGIFDNTGFNNLETVGNAQIDTTTKKYGTGSLEFDGNGDVLLIPRASDWQFGTENFTVEGWFYLAGAGSSGGFFTTRADTNAFAPVQIQFESGALKGLASTSGSAWTVNITSSTTPSATTWYHVAFVRNGGTFTLYLDGVSVGSTSGVTSALMTNVYGAAVGAQAANATNPLNGYIDDLRITKGIARYTAAFTPPTKAFPNIGS